MAVKKAHVPAIYGTVSRLGGRGDLSSQRRQPASPSCLALNSHAHLSKALGKQSRQSRDHMGTQGVEKVVKTEVW